MPRSPSKLGNFKNFAFAFPFSPIVGVVSEALQANSALHVQFAAHLREVEHK